MKRTHLYIYTLSAIMAAMMSDCKKPYNPKLAAVITNYLVVEGVINSGPDSTIIKLSRTISLTDSIKTSPELGALIIVESDQHTTYPLQEMGNGKYASPPLYIDNTQKYHLRIRTLAGKEYTSDFESVKSNPPIDSVGFVQKSNGINLYVNTHDPNNNTRYYRWDYTETWNFHAKYRASYITDGTQLNPRFSNQQIYTCFGNQASNAIILASSAKLAQDVIYQTPLTAVPSASEKLETKYSILVRQYAMTSEEYNFWQNLKKNTEQLGSIFDAQPSELRGNIHRVDNPLEPVLGYIGVTNIQQKRIFISKDQLPDTWLATYPYQCSLDTLLLVNSGGQNDVQEFLIPIGTTEFAIEALVNKQGKLIGYLGSDSECADCTIRGSTTQPAFWR